MEDKEKMMESLLEKAADYGKTSYELIKLKTLDKISEAVSCFLPNAVAFIMITSFLLFLNLGVAIWLGGILGNISYGFFAVAAFYGFLGIIIYFFIHKWLKKKVCNYIIKQALK